MNIEECYVKLHGDYADVLERLGIEKLVVKFVLKYPMDDTVEKLKAAVASGEISEQFYAAHTLKGVAGNLSFKQLQKYASDLTEQLRPQKEQADPELLKLVLDEQEHVLGVIKEYEETKS